MRVHASADVVADGPVQLADALPDEPAIEISESDADDDVAVPIAYWPISYSVAVADPHHEHAVGLAVDARVVSEREAQQHVPGGVQLLVSLGLTSQRVIGRGPASVCECRSVSMFSPRRSWRRSKPRCTLACWC